MHLICGMHRSGSSPIARLVALAGADLGDPSGLYKGDRWNPDGYYEQREIIVANSRLINGPWGRLAYLSLPSERTIRARGHRCRATISDLAYCYRDKVVKENRFCLTLPVWRQYGAVIEKLVVVFREPQAVADSLWRRNWLPRRRALSLWLEHYSRLLRTTQDVPVTYIWYDRFVSSPDEARAQMRRLLAFLGEDAEKAEQVTAAGIRYADPPFHRENRNQQYPEAIDSMYRKLIDRAEA